MTALAAEQSVGALLVDLLPLMIGAAVSPIPVIIALLLLSSPRGVSKTAALVSGAIAVRLAQGILFGYILASDPAATSDTGGNLIVSTLLIVIAILMLIAAYKKWTSEEDPDAPPPKWMSALGGLSTPKAAGMGAALVVISAKQWVFTLAAIGVIGTERLGPPTSIALFLLYVLAAQSLGLVAVTAYAIAPQATGRILAPAREWLDRKSHRLMAAFSLIFGLFFLFKGISALIR